LLLLEVGLLTISTRRGGHLLLLVEVWHERGVVVPCWLLLGGLHIETTEHIRRLLLLLRRGRDLLTQESI
jgi:hypothetical protein